MKLLLVRDGLVFLLKVALGSRLGFFELIADLINFTCALLVKICIVAL